MITTKFDSLVSANTYSFFADRASDFCARESLDSLLNSFFHPVSQIEEKTEILSKRFSSKVKQALLKCPTDETICKNDNLESSLNYLCYPGKHTIKSVVVGTRADELRAVKAKMKTEPILKEFENSLYQPENINLIPNKCQKIADEIANRRFARYLDKYRHCGLNEANAIAWSDWKFREGVTNIITIENEWNTWNVHAIVQKNGHLKSGKYLPPGITAYHELMHVEEIPKLFKNTNNESGDELLPTLTTLMQLDEVFKSCKNLEMSREVDYQQIIKVYKVALPLGKIANCYRSLTKNLGRLVDAVLSNESLNFLKTGTCNFD